MASGPHFIAAPIGISQTTLLLPSVASNQLH